MSNLLSISNRMKLRNILKAAVLCGIVISLSTACGNGSKPGQYGYKELLSNASGITFDDVQIVELAKDVVMGPVRKIKAADSLVFVCTDDNLYSFHLNGSLNAVYGMQGRAANEYLYLGAFFVDAAAKQVCLIDATQGKLLYYSYDGTFIKKQQFESLSAKLSLMYDASLLPDGRLFAHNRIYNDNGLLFSIIDLNDGTATDFKSVPFKTANTAEFCGEHLCDLYDGHLHYILPFDPNIYLFNGNEGSVCREIPGVEKVLTAKDLEEITDYNFFKTYNMYNEGTFVGFSGLYETDSLIFLNELETLNYYIIDKNTGVQRRYTYSYDEEELQTIPFQKIRASYKDWLIGVVDPSLITMISEDFEDNTSDPFLNKVHSVAGRIKDDSNPCLIFYKIKSIQ